LFGGVEKVLVWLPLVYACANEHCIIIIDAAGERIRGYPKAGAVKF